jgi:hypothetical protein
LSEEQYLFHNKMVSRGFPYFGVAEFLVATANLIHPSEHRGSKACISAVRILKGEHNVVTFTPFSQKEFDNGPLFLLNAHCHFSGYTI